MERPTYGPESQYAKDDSSPLLSGKRINYLQRVVGKFLYYARAIGNTMLHALSSIARAATKGAKATEDAAQHLMGYAYSNPDAQTKFRASDMIIQGDSDAAYLVEPDARSRAGGFHFLGNKEHTMFNGPIHVLAKTIKAVMASAMEAEMKALFMNAQLLVEYRQTLEDMGHPQPPTRIRIDNRSAHGVLTGIMKQKRTKSAGMNASWVKDRCD